MPNALQIADPNADNPLAQSFDPRQFGAESEAELSPLELWLAQQRAKNNAQGFEPLPGITSGAPPKPWGLDRTQLPQQAMPQNGYLDILQRIRPVDVTADPRMRAFRGLGTAPLKLPGGGFSQNYSPLRPPDEFPPEPDWPWRQFPRDRNI